MDFDIERVVIRAAVEGYRPIHSEAVKEIQTEQVVTGTAIQRQLAEERDIFLKVDVIWAVVANEQDGIPGRGLADRDPRAVEVDHVAAAPTRHLRGALERNDIAT